MRFFFPGFLAGAVASLFLFTPVPGIEIYPEWWAPLNGVAGLEKSPFLQPEGMRFFVREGERFYILGGNGEIAAAGSTAGGLAAFSGDGLFHAGYRKAGSDIELYNYRGERFWRLESLEYPYLSHSGRLIFLLNGDHTSVRFVDVNGNEIGEGNVSGRTCTALSFSDRGDFGGVGFLDGSYYIIDAKGRVINRGRTPKGTLVKGIAESGSGGYASVHYGGSLKDFVRVVDIRSGEYHDIALNHVHTVKTPLYITEEGDCTVIDVDRILCMTPSASKKFEIAIPPKSPGTSAVSCGSGVCAASYSMQNGPSRLIVFRDDGVVVFSNEYPTESYLDAVIRGNLIFARGSNNIFCYSLHRVRM
jgi:hypothetical protein